MYHETNGKFPYATLDRQLNDSTSTYATGFILILPFLEQDPVAKRWNPNLVRNSTDDSDGDGFTNASLQKLLIPTYTCPRDDTAHRASGRHGKSCLLQLPFFLGNSRCRALPLRVGLRPVGATRV